MINHYSTIVQFTAAIYLTLSFDNILFRSLWSLDYARLINDRISKMPLATSSKIAEELKRNILTNATRIEKKSRLRGFSVLIFSIITMWIMGFEQEHESIIETLHSVYFVYVLLSIVGFIISCIYIERLLCQFFLSAAILLVSFFSIFVDLHFLKDFCFTFWIVDHISGISSLLILIPLLLQLVTSWLYSENYYYMLSGTIKNEYDLYNRAIGANKSEDLPDEYKDAINKCWFDKEQGESNDTKITNLSNTFKERLKKAIETPPVLTIVKYAIANIFKVKRDELALIEKSDINGDIIRSEEENVPQPNTEPSNITKGGKQKGKTITKRTIRKTTKDSK